MPVPVTTFSPIATGGVNQQPITSFNYENIGVNIDITPRTHLDNDVTLALAISVTSISGEGFGGLPTFGNRLIKTTIRLRDGETNMLAGLIRDDERRVRDGIPGLSDIPAVGHMFGHSQQRADPDRRHPDADAAHRARAGVDGRRSARLPDGPRFGTGAPDLRPGGPAGGIDLPLPGSTSAPAPRRPGPARPGPDGAVRSRRPAGASRRPNPGQSPPPQ